jgi:acyl carrier protein
VCLPEIWRYNDMAMDREQVLEQVKTVMVDALGVDDDEVKPEATLMGDLGAESIDFLDIVFRLEKAFGIKIARSNGKLTAKGVAELKARMPHTDTSEFEKNPEISKLPDLFTVGMIVNYVTSKLKAA